MKIQIRNAAFGDPQDAAAIVDILDSYAADPAGGGAPLSDDVRRRLVPGLRKVSNALALLGFADGQPVGIAVCFFGFSTFNAQPLLNIHDLAVVPAHRGKGIGRALLAEAEARARESGCCRLTLEVHDSNTTARSLYSQSGFADYVLGDSAATRFLIKPIL
jgi:ribosomal protein S18 acetylase RimI-like enzyme